MFSALFDLLMTPVNFVRKTFGWMPEEVSDVVEDVVELQEATVANGGPSASNFAALRQSSYDDGDSASASSLASAFMAVSLDDADIISTEDWQTLSMAEIDAELVANGESAIGDVAGDPFYDLNPLEIADLTDAEFQALLDQVNWGTDLPVWEGIITDEDWANLSMAEIDTKMESNGQSAIGDAAGDPFYDLTPAEIDALTDEEYANTVAAYGWDDLYFPSWEGVIAVSDLDILSAAELDAKLLAADFETVGLEDSPFYNLTGEDIQLLPETALAQLYEDEQAVFESLGYDVLELELQDAVTVVPSSGDLSGDADGVVELDWITG